MKKMHFWLAMCLLSLLNGGLFCFASFRAMQHGAAGADNQAGLLFVPVLWMMAAVVLLILNLATLLSGRTIAETCRIPVLQALSPDRQSLGQVGFLAVTLLLMLFAFLLFAGQGIWAAAYALTGGALMLLLYSWRTAARKTRS